MYIFYELKISIFLFEKFEFLKLYESARSQWTDIHPTFIIFYFNLSNTHTHTHRDFKYYDDPGDQFRDNVGSMLPLWRFKFDKARKAAITALSWNPLYSDLFAVGRGSCEYSEHCLLL